MAKINNDILDKAIRDILAYSKGETITMQGVEKEGKVRKFRETIDFQVTLKNYDPRKDKRFAGTFKLPKVPRPNMKVCLLGNEVHCDEAKAIGLDHMSVADLKKMNGKKNKKAVKKLAKKYDAFIASQDLIKKIPRLLGPGLNRAGKFPSVVGTSAKVEDKVAEIRATVKFQLKKVMCLNVAVGNVGMSEKEVKVNVQLTANFLASLLKKNWQNIKVIYIKSTMGPSHQIYF
jgi:large subunit ribosomal protein L10Ae